VSVLLYANSLGEVSIDFHLVVSGGGEKHEPGYLRLLNDVMWLVPQPTGTLGIDATCISAGSR
jgi:hypothetical protein